MAVKKDNLETTKYLVENFSFPTLMLSSMLIHSINLRYIDIFDYLIHYRPDLLASYGISDALWNISRREGMMRVGNALHVDPLMEYLRQNNLESFIERSDMMLSIR